MPTAATVYIASDGSRWDSEEDAAKRDALDAEVRAIEATIPKPPSGSKNRVAVDPAAFKAAKIAVIELCRREYPKEPVFKHDPMEIHPMSFAGRFLSDNGGPLNRIWWRFCCHRDGWMYEQPYFALNPDRFEGDGT
jgi:hypothetical protein